LNPPSLILIGPTPPPAFGTATLTPVLLDVLDRRGLLAAHLDTRDPRPLDRLARFDLENLSLGLRHTWALAGLLRRHPGADVMLPISQGRWGFLRDALWVHLAKAAGRRVFVHVNGGRMGDFFAASSPPMRRLIAATLWRADGLWALTPALRPILERIVPGKPVGLLPNAVPDPGPSGPARHRSDGALRVLFLSNLRPGKGHRELVDAVALLGESARGWTVRLVGEVPSHVRSELLELARERCAADVQVPGSLLDDAKWRELGEADVFVLPTSYPNEGQPLSVLEAMATGLPVIATRYRGLPDTIADGSEGVLLDRPDPELIAAALLELSGDPERRRRLGEAARDRYERDFSPERFGERLAELLA
jgi:glycosyltransferase involved in cell wall biosynthesis